MDLLVFAEQPSPRLEWILKEILGRRLGLDFLVVDNAEAYRHGSLPGLTYAREKQGRRHELLISPAGLLAEKGVTPALPPAGEVDGVPVLFPCETPAGLGMDVFSAAFYMLSRYEEYLPFEPDNMGRFPYRQSLAWREGWLDKPVVEMWSALLAKKLKEVLGIPEKKEPAAGRFLPTFDIDQAFAYRHKSWLRMMAGGLKAGNLKERLAVWQGRQEDPFDNIPDIIDLHRGLAELPVFFFHVGKWGRYDKSVSPAKEEMRKIIREAAARAAIGLHPSVRAAHDLSLIAVEKERLERAAGMPVTRSRMHYLILRFPEIPRALLEAGFREDHTMGFPEIPGFRAGTCYPFNWYDLEREEETSLQFIPLTVMDGALRKGAGAVPEEVPALLSRYRAKTEKYRGMFVTLWHNHTYAGADGWSGWGEAYRQWIRSMGGEGSGA